MERMHVFLPAPVRADLKALSQQRDTSIGELIRQAVAAFIERTPRTVPANNNEHQGVE